MKANPDKCNLLVTTNALTSVNINGFQIRNSTEEKLLGIKFDSELSFENHMFHSRKLNYRINIIHERALRVTYQDYKSTFLELLQRDNSLTIRQ